MKCLFLQDRDLVCVLLPTLESSQARLGGEAGLGLGQRYCLMILTLSQAQKTPSFPRHNITGVFHHLLMEGYSCHKVEGRCT